MKISAISDVHIKSPNDQADQLLNSFLIHPLVVQSNVVLLLGDIFDLMCGPHDEYIKDYGHIFKKITELKNAGKEIYFFEGNHDIHLQGLFKKALGDDLNVLRTNPLIKEIDGKMYYFSHGDEHEIDNKSYQNYKKIILSSPLEFIANKVMPYKLLKFVGEYASNKSRKKGAKIFNEAEVRDRFRQGVMETTNGKYQFVLGGHSHVQDIFHFPQGSSVYINNGYALRTKTFIHLDNHEVKFVSL